LVIPFYCFAQEVKPLYLSLNYGTDLTTEKSDRILPYAPSFVGLSLEKRFAKKDFYGIGLNYFYFTDYYSNYQHLSLRGYQHFGLIEDTQEANIDPYFGIWGGVERWKNKFKPTVGVFLGIRFMFRPKMGVHAEIGSSSSGFGNELLFQTGITTCINQAISFKRKYRGTHCPKF